MGHFRTLSAISDQFRPQNPNPRQKIYLLHPSLPPYGPFLAISWPFLAISLLFLFFNQTLPQEFRAFLYIFLINFVICWQTLFGRCQHIFGGCSNVFLMAVKIYIPGKNPPWPGKSPPRLGKNLCGGANTVFRGVPKTFKNSIFGKKCFLIYTLNLLKALR